jgi:hypothetical protein
VKKNAHDATDDENLVPGSHDDASPLAEHIMRALIQTTVKAFPGVQVTVLLIEPLTERMNYASNCSREDIVAMMKSFIKRARTDFRT